MIISQDISGEIMVNCRLSGMPDLVLSFQDPSVLDDVSFHPCVRFNRFERDRVLSFIPPDGNFQLAKYRSTQQADLPLYVRPQFSWHGSSGKIVVMCGLKNARGREVEDVVVTLPFPKTVATVNYVANTGAVTYDEVSKVNVCAICVCVVSFVYVWLTWTDTVCQVCRWNIGTLNSMVVPQLTCA